MIVRVNLLLAYADSIPDKIKMADICDVNIRRIAKNAAAGRSVPLRFLPVLIGFFLRGCRYGCFKILINRWFL